MVVGFRTSITTAASSAAVSTAAIKSALIRTRLLRPCNSSRSYIHLFTVSCGSMLYPVKAMAGADTVSIPMADSQASGSGRKQALISLSDKKDLAFLGNGLQELGYTIVSTGGTASALETAGVSVTKVEQLTGFPEMLDVRVKTLHPNIHGGILARRDQKQHMEALIKHGIVVVNLYPFYDKVSSAGGIAFEDGIENIDISGPAMIRAAAKNHNDVLVVVDSKTILNSQGFFNAIKMTSSFKGSSLPRLFNMLLLMILQFQSGCGRRLLELNGASLAQMFPALW